MKVQLEPHNRHLTAGISGSRSAHSQLVCTAIPLHGMGGLNASPSCQQCLSRVSSHYCEDSQRPQLTLDTTNFLQWVSLHRHQGAKCSTLLSQYNRLKDQSIYWSNLITFIVFIRPLAPLRGRCHQLAPLRGHCPLEPLRGHSLNYNQGVSKCSSVAR